MSTDKELAAINKGGRPVVGEEAATVRLNARITPKTKATIDRLKAHWGTSGAAAVACAVEMAALAEGLSDFKEAGVTNIE